MRRGRPHSPASDNWMDGPIPEHIISDIRTENASWETLTESLQYITTASLQTHDETTKQQFIQQLRCISNVFAICINGLRSTLVKEACYCIQSLATHLGPPFVDAVGDEVIPALLRGTAIKKAVIREGCLSAIRAIFEQGVEGVSLDIARLLSQNVIDKKTATDVRHTASQCIGMILVERCRSGLQVVNEVVQDAIIYGCRDPDEAVRAQSRQNCLRLEALDPTYGKIAMQKLAPNVQLLIEKEREDFVMDDDMDFAINTSPSMRSQLQRSNLPQRVIHPHGKMDSTTVVQDKEVSPRANHSSLFSSMPRPASRNQPYKADITESVENQQNMSLNLPSRPGRRVVVPERNISVAPPANTKKKPPRPSMRPPRRSIHPGSVMHTAMMQKAVMKTSFAGATRPTSSQMLQRTAPLTENKSAISPSNNNVRSPSSVSSHDSSPVSSTSSKDLSQKDDLTSSEASISSDEKLKITTPVEMEGKKTVIVEESSANDKISGQIDSKVEVDGNSEGEVSSEPTVSRITSIDASSKSEQSDTAKIGAEENSNTETSVDNNEDKNENTSDEDKMKKQSFEEARKGRLSFILGTNVTPTTNSRTEWKSKCEEKNSGTAVVTGCDEKKGEEQTHEDALENKTAVVSTISDRSKESASDTETCAKADSGFISEQPKIQKIQSVRDEDINPDNTLDAKSSSHPHSPISKPNPIQSSNVAKPPAPQPPSEKENKHPTNQTTNDKKTQRVLSKLSKPPISTTRALKTTSTGITKSKKSTIPPRRPPRRSVMPLSNPQIRPNGTAMTSTQSLSKTTIPRAATVSGNISRNGLTTTSTSKSTTSSISNRSVISNRQTRPVKPTITRTVSASIVPSSRSTSVSASRSISSNISNVSKPSSTSSSENSLPTTRPRSSSVAELFRSTRPTFTNALNGITGGDENKQPPVRRLLPESVQLVITCLRAATAAKSSNWAKKDTALGAFTDSLRRLNGEKLSGRLAEDCVIMLGEYVHETHHKILLGALDGLFFLFLCTEGNISTTAMQRVLERRPEIIRRVLHLMKDGHEDVRLGCTRVMQGYEVQFGPETQVAIIIRAMTGETRPGTVTGRRIVTPDGRIAEKGCAHLLNAFERADTSGDGFVWKAGVLRSLVEMLGALSKDRRIEVRRAAGEVVDAVKKSLPETAFSMVCKKVGVML